MIKQLLKIVLKLLAGVTAEQWEKAFQYIQTAAKTAMTSENKRAWVSETLKSEYPKLANWVVNFLIEAGVAFMKSRSEGK